MRVDLPFWQWQIFLGSVLVLRRGRRCRRWFEREEAFENALRLPLGRVRKVDPNIHSSGATKRGVEALDVVGGGEQKARGEQ